MATPPRPRRGAGHGRDRKKGTMQQFVGREIEMLKSPAYRVLSLSAHRVMSRLEIELANHGGQSVENGKLPCTYDDFVAYGIDRNAIRPAINELIELGFVEITEKGCAGNENFRRPNKFRLTYKGAGDRKFQRITDDWRRIKTIEEAEEIAAAARKQRAEKRSPVGVSRRRQYGKPRLETPIHSGENQITGHSRETPITSISRGMAPTSEGPQTNAA